MSTIHATAAERAAQRAMQRDPRDAVAIMDTLAGVQASRWNHEGLQDALGQPYNGWTPGQAYAFLRLLEMVHTGQVARCRINVGTYPASDKAREENARALLEISDPFTADVDMEQHNAGGDGYLWWHETIELDKGWGGDSAFLEPISRESAGVDLEIGFCSPSRIFLHLMDRGWVARWPYGSDWVWLFTGTPDPHQFVCDTRASFDFLTP